MKKNVKGYIGLFLGLASILAIIVSAIPMTKLTGFGIDGKINFWGNTNLIIALLSIPLAIAAIVFGAM